MKSHDKGYLTFIDLLQQTITWYMMAGKLIIIPALGHQNKGKSSFTGLGLFVLMSQCGNNNVHEILNGWYRRMRLTYVSSFCPLKRSKAKSWKICRVRHAIQQFTLLRSDPSWTVVIVSQTWGQAKAVVLTLKLRENSLSPNHVAL